MDDDERETEADSTEAGEATEAGTTEPDSTEATEAGDGQDETEDGRTRVVGDEIGEDVEPVDTGERLENPAGGPAEDRDHERG